MTQSIVQAFPLPNIRKLFIPDPGFTMFDSDLDRADLQVVVWESGEPELKAALKMGVDMHILNATTLAGKDAPLEELVESHPRYDHWRGTFKKERQLAKSFIHGCITAGHEVLTPQGWIAVESYIDGTPILAWNTSNRAFWDIPSYFHRDNAVDLISFEGESWSQEMTWDHRVPYDNDSTGWRVALAMDIGKSARLPKSGLYEPIFSLEGLSDNSFQFARQIAAYQADGTLDSSNALVFHIRKKRKLERLKELFPEATVSQWSDDSYGVRVPREQHFITPDYKIAGPWMLSWSCEALQAWLQELPHWDGTYGKTSRVEVMGVSKQHIEWVATISHLCGKAASLGVKTNREGNRQDLWCTGINNRTKARVSSMKITRRVLDMPVRVYCPRVSSGYFFFRRNGKIGVTGNTNYGGKERTMAIAAGITVAQAARFQSIYFGKYPGIKKWHERTEAQLHKHRFVENKFGYRRQYFDRLDGLLPEALAWVPQSTVALVINKIWHHLFTHHPHIQVLLQVHDSLVGQFPTHRKSECIQQIKAAGQAIVIPYDDPLTIPIGVKTSESSWGEVM
jgi:hypothetical protein